MDNERRSVKTMLRELWGRLSGKKALRVGGYSVLASVIVLAIAVALNVLVNALPSSWTQYDTTSSQVFSISEQTEGVLAALEEDVTVYWVVQSGQEDETLGTLLDRYAALSSHITVEKRDPDVYPAFMEQYITGTIYNNSLVVESAERYTYVGYDSLYSYSYDSSYNYIVTFSGESELTSAIDYVVSDDLPVVYTLSGHGETELSTSFSSSIEALNVEVNSLSLIETGEIPEDADCLLILAPESDISADELSLIQTYLAEGGGLILITDPEHESGERPNLDALMESYGVTAEDGIVVEGDSGNYAFGTPVDLLPEYGSHEITSSLSSEGYYVLLPVAQGLTVSDELPDGVSVTELLTTSDSSYSKLSGYSMSTYDKADGDISGPFALAVAITADAEEGSSNIVWISSSYIIDESTDAMVSGGNTDLFLNSISWICGETEGIAIHAKTLSNEYLTMTSSQANMISTVLIVAIPVFVLVCGIYIYVRRRRT